MNFNIIMFISFYLIGSIPFGLVLSYIVGIGDIRKTGSGNIGATNVFRKSKRLAVVTLLLDASKSFTCIAIAHRYSFDHVLFFLAALFAIVGHIFPVWLLFKGGKGVAPLLGSFVFIDYKIAMCFIIFWIAFFIVYRYSSLSSIASTLITLLFVCICYTNTECIVFAVTVLLVITQHIDNIIRIINGNENKISLKS
ncbi:glycerol-3-phosphate acyltransferase [Ehrlichia ruminantium]|uniref:Glycerol-3-phosphate acyltransferase n=1 Tax=Ehrlichia ruminantium TaxID=779 RepID=A0AAE6Q8G1_EHRRU|nr:glycerol-3-phosphate 1-O-acyltransferase PlsY [Ehrlichia ruminantium]QGR03024.1 glycerol-3-phosphate acyltransferase [Ehrlichia ruminantium]QGR03949.1 glycerol-3-phosphate acyltransferase [Ehrlichia ruminantium]